MSVSLGLFATGLLALSMGVSSLKPQRSIDISRLDNAVLDSFIMAAGKNYGTTTLDTGAELDNFHDFDMSISGYQFVDGYKFNPEMTYRYSFSGQFGDDFYFNFYDYKDNLFEYDLTQSFSFVRDYLFSVACRYIVSGNSFEYFTLSYDYLWDFGTILTDEFLSFESDDSSKIIDTIHSADFIVVRMVRMDGAEFRGNIVTGLIYHPTNNYPITFFVDNYIDRNFPYTINSYVGFDTLYWSDRDDNFVDNPTGLFKNYSLLEGINPQNNYEYYYSSIGNNVNLSSDIGFGAYQPHQGDENVRNGLGNQRIHTQVHYSGMSVPTDYYESTFTLTSFYYDDPLTEAFLFNNFAIYGYVVNKFAFDYSDDFDAIAQENYKRGYEDGRTVGLTQGYDNGYNRGFADGVSQGGNASFIGLFGSIADTPILMIRSLFDFDLFGINMLTVVLSLTTGLIVMFLIRKFI